jgi:hypothetical protein
MTTSSRVFTVNSIRANPTSSKNYTKRLTNGGYR